MRPFLSTSLAFLLSFKLFGQFVLTNNQTPKDLVQNILKGQNVAISNIRYNGNLLIANSAQENVSFFQAKGTTFPFKSGILLTTGKGIGALGPNNSNAQSNGGTPNVGNDPHLIAIANGTVTNGAVIEFDILPSGDFISFRYVFGSEEYPEYSPSSDADAFGLFIWGTGISGPYTLSGYPAGGTNLAVIPGTATPINSNNVNPTNNNAYYVSNNNGQAYGNAIQYDGTTKVLYVRVPVQCGQTYHMKFAIANVSDETLDSGVFLEAGSFHSNVLEVITETPSEDSSVYEGCTKAKVIFKRPFAPLGAKVSVKYKINGTAINGTDFDLLTSPIVFNANNDTASLTVNPIKDGIIEAPEQLIISTHVPNQCGDTVVTNHLLWIQDKPKLDLGAKDTLLLCKSDSVLINVKPIGGIGKIALSWSTGEMESAIWVPADENGKTDYSVTMTDQCGNTLTDTLTVNVKQTLAIDSLTSGPSTCEPNGWVSATVSGATGVPLNKWNGPGAKNPTHIDATVWDKLSSGWYYFTIQDDICEERDSVFVDILNPPKSQFSIEPNFGCPPLQTSITNNSQNADRYKWDFGNGQTLETTNMDAQKQQYLTSSIVQLIAYQGTLCSDTSYSPIFTAVCGCMNKNALNYNPLAIFEDGSCKFPDPTVVAPNVFTPNGDGVNEKFNLNVSYAKSIYLAVLNRWGNLMFEMESVNTSAAGPQWNGPAWNGETEAGIPVTNGVYFFKYRVVGFNDQQLEGHGFFELIR